MLSHQQFYEKMLPYARKWSARTGFDPGVLLAQLSVESGWGNSDLAADHNNYAGIKCTGNAPDCVEMRASDGNVYEWGSYPSIESFGRDYVRILKLGYLKRARRAAQRQEPKREVFRLLGLGSKDTCDDDQGLSYAAGCYSGGTDQPGKVLMDRYRHDNIRQFVETGPKMSANLQMKEGDLFPTVEMGTVPEGLSTFRNVAIAGFLLVALVGSVLEVTGLDPDAEQQFSTS